MMKNILTFIIFLIPWYIGTLLFPVNIAYYQSLNLPFYLPPLSLTLTWTILYLCITYVTTKVYHTYQNSAKEYFLSLLFNYILNILFTYFFFTLESPFLGFTDSIILFISTLICYYEARELDKSLSIYFIPYLVLTLGTSVYLLFTIFLNL